MVRLDQQEQLVRMAVEDPKAHSAQPDPLARLDLRVPMDKPDQQDQLGPLDRPGQKDRQDQLGRVDQTDKLVLLARRVQME